MQYRTAYDSTNPGLIPRIESHFAFVYFNGAYAATTRDINELTAAGMQVARIDVLGNAWDNASILDVEPHDATPNDARYWVVQRERTYHDAVLYCSLNTLPALTAATHDLAQPIRLWVAQWDGNDEPPVLSLPNNSYVWGKQFYSSPGWDESRIYDPAWHADPPF
jgi:hypothetical protein